MKIGTKVQKKEKIRNSFGYWLLTDKKIVLKVLLLTGVITGTLILIVLLYLSIMYQAWTLLFILSLITIAYIKKIHDFQKYGSFKALECMSMGELLYGGLKK